MAETVDRSITLDRRKAVTEGGHWRTPKRGLFAKAFRYALRPGFRLV